MVESTFDWKKEFFNNDNFEQNKPFNYDLCVTYFEEAAKDLNNLNPWFLFRAIWEITKAFKALSTALSVGFSDITSKVEVWRTIIKENYSDCNTVQEVLEKELNLKIHELNGDNNSDFGHKKKTQYYTYVSGTRTLLRLTWFLDFFNSILKNSEVEKTKGFNDCIRMAYDKALAPHHPWLVRKGAGIGISLAPSKREKAMNAFFGKETYDEEVQAKIRRWQEVTYKIWEKLYAYYETNKLLSLP